MPRQEELKYTEMPVKKGLQKSFVFVIQSVYLCYKFGHLPVNVREIPKTPDGITVSRN